MISASAVANSSTISFIDTIEGKAWLKKTMRKAHGAKIAAEAKTEARKRAIVHVYELKKGMEAREAFRVTEIAAHYAAKKIA